MWKRQNFCVYFVRIVYRRRRCKLCWNRWLLRQWRYKDLFSWEERTQHELFCWGKKMGKPLFRRKLMSWSWTFGQKFEGAKASSWKKRKTSCNKFCVFPKGLHQNFKSKCWELLRGGARSLSEKNRKKTVENDKTSDFLSTEKEGTKIFPKRKIGRH